MFVVLWALFTACARPQTTVNAHTFLASNARLTRDQISTIDRGQAVAKPLPSRIPREVFLFGAVFVKAAPESYLRFARDFDALRKLPSYLALRVISDPPQLSDFQGFSLEAEDIKDLKSCKPGDCEIQLPASGMETLQQTIDLSSPAAAEKVNEAVRRTALERLQAYQREGNHVLGVYNDKRHPTDVAKQFAYMLSYYRAFPEHAPDFYNYLLEYPNARPVDTEDLFYWTRVKFGLKPTLRIVHVMTVRKEIAGSTVYIVAEKQLYSSHYFETALDLTFCIPSDDPTRPGFYLIRVMGSEQAGLTGFKGSFIRGVAVDRSVGSLRKSLAAIKAALESPR